MNKTEFTDALRRALSGLPKDDIEQRVEFYSEMIDDRMEEGLSEEQAISELGSIEDIVSQILSETPFSKLVKEKVRTKRKLSGWEVTLIILGFPLWLPLLAAAFAVVLAIYASVWSVIISLWAVFAAFAAYGFAAVVCGAAFAGQGEIWQGLATIGLGLVSGGASIFIFYGCKAATKGLIWLTKRTAMAIKNAFIKKGAA